MRVLVCDQESEMLERIAREFEVDVATSKATCIDLMRANPFDVLVASERLVDGSGLELLSNVATRWPDTLRVLAIEPERRKMLGGKLAPFRLHATIRYPIDEDELERRLAELDTLLGDDGELDEEAPSHFDTIPASPQRPPAMAAPRSNPAPAPSPTSNAAPVPRASGASSTASRSAIGSFTPQRTSPPPHSSNVPPAPSRSSTSSFTPPRTSNVPPTPSRSSGGSPTPPRTSNAPAEPRRPAYVQGAVARSPTASVPPGRHGQGSSTAQLKGAKIPSGHVVTGKSYSNAASRQPAAASSPPVRRKLGNYTPLGAPEDADLRIVAREFDESIAPIAARAIRAREEANRQRTPSEKVRSVADHVSRTLRRLLKR